MTKRMQLTEGILSKIRKTISNMIAKGVLAQASDSVLDDLEKNPEARKIARDLAKSTEELKQAIEALEQLEASGEIELTPEERERLQKYKDSLPGSAHTDTKKKETDRGGFSTKHPTHFRRVRKKDVRTKKTRPKL